MYPEIQEWLEKVKELLDLNDSELSELENILFLTFSAGYDKALIDIMQNNSLE
jgi:hypothetical protein